jgi:hypothetical protein
MAMGHSPSDPNPVADADTAGEVVPQPLWVFEGEHPVQRWVETGLSGGVQTERVAGLQAGNRIILGPAGTRAAAS